MLETYLSACLVGLVIEIIARAGRLWIYRKPINPVINILIMFGLVMGGLSLAVPTLGHGPVLLIAAAIGYGYERFNFAILGWWDFPGDRFLVFEGKHACSLSVGALWGGVPLITHYLSHLIF
jgi:hypothetical protein